MVTPLGHRVLVKPVEIKNKTEGGLWKPEQTVDLEKGGVDKGTVMALGSTAYMADQLGGEPWVKVGDKVVWARYAGKPVEDSDGTLYHLINDEDILAREE
jgi:chaperonin GroES